MDQQLTENFSLYELTRTDHAALQEVNRKVDTAQILKLTAVATLLESVRTFLGVPLKVTSGYRCLQLNRAEGSSDRSQHLVCEAADFIPIGLEIGNAFRLLWKEVRDGRRPVGQLIFETAQRSYGVASWIHISLGAPYRAAERCNQVLRMEDGKYTLFGEAGV